MQKRRRVADLFWALALVENPCFMPVGTMHGKKAWRQKS